MSDEKKYCTCGCGEEVKNKWVRGHHSRVNNISKRADIRKKRSDKWKEMHSNGKLPPWNKGKTKESDRRLKKQGETWKKNLTTEMRFDMSRRMRMNRLNGVVPTFRGKDHSQWKGGTSSITERIRGSHQLYKWWKLPKLKVARFKCRACGSAKDLTVHHYDERMADIIKKFLPKDLHELSWDEESNVVDDVVAYHIKKDVSGIALCKECHEKVHDIEKKSGERLSLLECIG